MKINIQKNISVNVFPENNKPKIIVGSHERSGTHFLINSLANSFGYYNESFDFDHNLGINYYSSQNILSLLQQWNHISLRNIIKTHHHFDFFKDVAPELSKNYKFIYIYRDPRDVMVSFWRFLNHWEWNEGPKTNSISEFIQNKPHGGVLRYQIDQPDTMLERWENHVNSWLNDSVMAISYEDLHTSYEKQIEKISKYLEIPINKIEIPKRNENVVPPMGPGKIGTYTEFLTENDLQYFEEKIGETMQKLGYL